MGLRRAALVSTAAIVFLAGCSTSRLSHAAFVRKANAICAAYHARAAKLALPHTVAGAEEYARRTLPLYRSALTQLEDLKPPRADEPLVARWLASDRMIERDIVGIARAAHSRRVPSLDIAADRARTDNDRTAVLARRLGANVCARA